MKKLLKKKGFTLAELLIVVAIIAVLVAIAIPIFTSQLEKSRESTDASNIRAAYAELIANALLDDQTAVSTTVKYVQTQNSWQNASISGSIAAGYAGQSVTVTHSGQPTSGGSCSIIYTPATASGSTASVSFIY